MLLKLSFLLFMLGYVTCGPHSHKKKPGENLNSYHYVNGEHNKEFDHEVVLGSHDEAENFEHLPPDEAKRRLLLIAQTMDLNNDKFVDVNELTQWVLKSFKMLTVEEALYDFEDEDLNNDDKVKWEEHVSQTYNSNDDNEGSYFAFEDSEMFENDKELFDAADLNKDGFLDKSEFPAFSEPEEFDHMHEVVYNQAMKKRDKDKDGNLSFEEFIADSYGRAPDSSAEYFIIEKDRFEKDFDKDGDKKLNKEEVMTWLIPDNEDSARNEAEHLFESSDDDGDRRLSFEEIVKHYDVFVGSEITEFGDQLHNYQKFTDEL